MRVLWFLLLQIGIKTRALETHSVSTVWAIQRKLMKTLEKLHRLNLNLRVDCVVCGNQITGKNKGHSKEER